VLVVETSSPATPGAATPVVAQAGPAPSAALPASAGNGVEASGVAAGPEDSTQAVVQTSSNASPEVSARGGSEQQQRVVAAVSSGLLEVSASGAVVLKGQILALAPSPASLAIAHRLGYAVVERLPLKELGLSAVVLRGPSGLTADQALGRLQAADPKGGYSLNPIYAMTGQVGAPTRPASGVLKRAAAPADAGAVAVGLIDTGVFAKHPALAAAHLEQQGFAPGGLTPATHGTAVASIAAGQAGPFHGVAPGSRIYVADVYGKTGVGGSAVAVAEGIDWLVLKGAPVINVSLVGPSNRLMEAAVEAAIGKGVIVVAAVGNDGPNSPPLYPAAYRGVLAVTAVDQKDHILFEAVRATPVAFAAPGADIFAADGAGGFAKVRGTSFAAPIVAGQLALTHRHQGRKDALSAVQQLKRMAKAPADATFGFGIVGEDAREALRPGLPQFTTAQAGRAEHSEE
jgi:subtilisin family serine protease